jgi:hypothetical protein
MTCCKFVGGGAVADAFLDLEHALEMHEPRAASDAAWEWWEALQRLRDAS